MYRELATRDTANPMWHLNLGMALQSGGDSMAALAELGVFLKARPAPGPAHLLAGMAHLKCEAIEPLEKARQWQASAQSIGRTRRRLLWLPTLGTGGGSVSGRGTAGASGHTSGQASGAMLVAGEAVCQGAPRESCGVRAWVAAARGALGKALMDLQRAADAVPHPEAASAEDSALLLPLSQAYKSIGRAEDAARALADYRTRVK